MMAPLIPSSRPLDPPIAPVDTGRTENEKGKPVARRGRKARGLRLGDGSAAGLLTTTSRNHAHALRHLQHRPPARRHPGAGPDGRAAHAADAPFTPRFAQTARGDVAAVGNTLLTCPTATPGCTNAQDGIGGTLNNNNWNMTPVNVAGGTVNSSSATVTLPAGATVLWAGLYWGADTSAGTNGAVAPNAAAKGTVKFRVPGGSYQAISAAAGDVLTSSLQATRYRAFSDVTALVTPVAPAATRSPTSRRAPARTASPAGRCSSPTATTRSRSGA